MRTHIFPRELVLQRGEFLLPCQPDNSLPWSSRSSTRVSPPLTLPKHQVFLPHSTATLTPGWRHSSSEDTAITTQLQNKTFPPSSSVLHSNPFSSLIPQGILALRETQAISVPPPNSESHQRIKSGWFDRTYFCSTTLTGMNLCSQALILPLIEFCSDFSTCLPRINVRLIGCSCPKHLTHSSVS